MGWASAVGVAAAVALLACSGKQGSPSNGGGGASIPGQLAASECEGTPVPRHECVGGVPAPRCVLVNGVARWRLDCVPRDPSAPPDLRGVSPCESPQCGAEPAWDPTDCLHGFVGATASCESIDRGACTWTRRCRPRPCSVEEGTCNILHRDRLGEPCSASKPCPTGFSCNTISVGIGESEGPVCVAEPACEALTCAAGATCVILASYPGQIVCDKR